VPTSNHYRQAEEAFLRPSEISPYHEADAAQLHALLAIADELRNATAELRLLREAVDGLRAG
jgi:hypothetical protein